MNSYGPVRLERWLEPSKPAAITGFQSKKLFAKSMGRLRFELRTNRLKAECSTAELATRTHCRAPKDRITRRGPVPSALGDRPPLAGQKAVMAKLLPILAPRRGPRACGAGSCGPATICAGRRPA